MENKLIKIEPTQLDAIVTSSGLEIQQGEETKQSYLPFLIRLSEVQEESKKINYENPTAIDETIARELRLKTVKIRTGSAELKESRKRIHLLRGNLEQAADNLISASCKLAEETFASVEKARERAEAKRNEMLKSNRIEMLTPYEVETTYYDLANMPEPVFNKLLEDSKLSWQKRIDDALKAEQEKAEQLRLDKLESDRKLEIAPYNQFLKEPLDLRLLGIGEWDTLIGNLKVAKDDYDKKQEAIRIENERLKNEAIEKEKKAEEERIKQAKILADQKAEAEKKQKAIEEKAKAELEKAESEKKKIEAQIKAKEEAEKAEKAKKEERNTELRPYIIFIRDYGKMLNMNDADYKKELADIKIGAEQHWESERKKQQEVAAEQQRIEAEKKAKEIEEKKSAKAPDKTKMNKWIDDLELPAIQLKNIESQTVETVIREKFSAFKTWAKSNISNL